MTFRLKVCKTHYTDKGPGVLLAGNMVTDNLHRKITEFMTDKDVRSEIYKASKAVQAYFQFGFMEPQHKRIFIELWKHDDPEAVKEFERVLNKYLYRDIGEALTQIHVSPNTEGVYYYYLEIAKETGCPYNGGHWGSPLIYMPEDNEQWWKVYNLCKAMVLNIAFPKL